LVTEQQCGNPMVYNLGEFDLKMVIYVLEMLQF